MCNFPKWWHAAWLQIIETKQGLLVKAMIMMNRQWKGEGHRSWLWLEQGNPVSYCLGTVFSIPLAPAISLPLVRQAPSLPCLWHLPHFKDWIFAAVVATCGHRSHFCAQNYCSSPISWYLILRPVVQLWKVTLFLFPRDQEVGFQAKPSCKQIWTCAP